MKRLFFGGIHPKDKKEMSITGDPLQTITPKQVVLPMRQHIGVPCAPLVQVGDRVSRGQKIGDAEGLCVPVHASVSGRVIAIEPRPHTGGGQVLAVVIENDYKNETITAPIPKTEDEIISAIREAGIVGMGGAAFPGNVKALSAMGKIDTLIANGCECEPYITADDCLLQTHPEQVLEGMMIFYKLLQPERLVLAVEDNKPKTIEMLRSLQSCFHKIELRILPTRYPQGSEKQLIQAITRRQVPSGMLPVSVGCGVFNVSTFAAIFRAVRQGEALTSRIVTVSGEGIWKPQNFIVPIGTSFRELLEAAGGLKEGADRVISGGPMMGIAQGDLSVPVIKATNCVLCLLKESKAERSTVCLRCGKCVQVCPMGLQPLYLHRYIHAQQPDQLEWLHLMDCVECGCCAYTCPGKLPLVETFRRGKKMIREAGKQ